MPSFIENTVTAYDKKGNRFVKAKYIELVEVIRIPGKKYPRRKVLWRKNVKELEKINWFDRMVLWFAARTKNTKIVNIKKEFVKKVSQWSLPQAVYNLLESLDVISNLRKLDDNSRRTYSLIDFVVGYVTITLLGKYSKLRYYEEGQNILYSQNIQELHQIYRAVSVIGRDYDWQSLEELRVVSRNRLFKEKITIMLFDFTTIYWYSEIKDELRELGFSKDNQYDKVQVLCGMVLNEEGFPVGMELWEGNKSERKAIKEFINGLSKDLEIKELVFVGDSGMYSKGLLRELRELGWKVLIRLPKNALTKAEEEEILSDEGWEKLEVEEETAEVKKEVKELKRGADYRIVAIKDYKLKRRHQHQLKEYLSRFIEEDALRQLIEKGKVDLSKLKISANKVISKKTFGLLKLGDSELKFDKDRYSKLLKWSGITLLLTDTKSSIKDLIRSYGMLSKIESRWRDIKSGLHVRPVYHWRPKRVKGHFKLKFIALQVVSLLEKRLMEAGMDLSWEKAVRLLKEVKAVHISFEDGSSGWVRTEVADKRTLKIMRVLGVPTEKVVITLENNEAKRKKYKKRKKRNKEINNETSK